MKKTLLFVIGAFCLSVVFYSVFADPLFTDFTGGGGNTYTVSEKISSVPKNTTSIIRTKVLADSTILYLIELKVEGFNISQEIAQAVQCEKDSSNIESCIARVYPENEEDAPQEIAITTLELNVSLSDIDPNMVCLETNKQAMMYMNGQKNFEFYCSIREDAPNHVVIQNPVFYKSLAADRSLIPMTGATGYEVYQLSGEIDEHISMSLSQHPNRLLNGKTNAQDGITPRTDKIDISRSNITVNVHSSLDENIYPLSTTIDGQGYTKRNAWYYSRIASGYYWNVYSPNINNCPYQFCQGLSKYSGYGYARQHFCGVQFPLDVPLTMNNENNLPYGVDQYPIVTVYNPVHDLPDVMYLEDLSLDRFRLNIEVSNPVSYPSLPFISSNMYSSGIDTSVIVNDTYKKNINYVFPETMNSIFRYGATKNIPSLHYISRANQTGVSGTVLAEAKINIIKTRWRYDIDDYMNVSCRKRHCYNGCDDYYQNISVPIYKWIQEDPVEKEINLVSSASVDVYSSAAWLQTKGGNFGTNKAIEFKAGSTTNSFLYSSGERIFQDSSENFSSASTKYSSATNFTPENQSNAEFFVYGDKSALTSGGAQDFTSGANWYYDKAEDTNNNLTDQRYGFGQRGKEYQIERNASGEVNLPRNYDDDLLEREIFGRVRNWVDICDALSISECNTALSEFGGVTKLGNDFIINQSLKLNRGEIYYIPTGYDVVFGPRVVQALSKDILITGGSARLHIEDTAYINTNVLYGNNEAKSYLDIPNLRIEAERIIVQGDLLESNLSKKTPYKAVEFIESQLKAKHFFSGYSHTPLKILGDVIVDNVELQRLPSVYFDPQNFDKNPPSELIIEDYRKYVVPVPGDTIIRDSFNEWEQVNPQSGESVEPF